MPFSRKRLSNLYQVVLGVKFPCSSFENAFIFCGLGLFQYLYFCEFVYFSSYKVFCIHFIRISSLNQVFSLFVSKYFM